MSPPCISVFPRVLGIAFVLLFFTGLSFLPAKGAEPATEIHYLSGKGTSDAVLWDFLCTEGRKSGQWTKIRVPSCWEQEGFGTYVYGRTVSKPPQSNETGKYRTTFRAPADWAGRVVRLVFEGAMTDTEAWVNGKSTGPLHQGGFYQFKYDITSLLRMDGENTLEVSVRRDSANESIDRAERWGDYWNFSGLFRPVYLEILPAQFIDRVAIDAKATGAIETDVFLSAPLRQGFRVTAQIEDRQGAPVGEPFSAAVPDGADHVRLSGKANAPALWTAETPHLYHLRITLEGQAAPIHVINPRFGFRTIEVRAGDGFYLNGKRIVLKGTNRHCFWPDTGRTIDPEMSYADVRLLQEMNMNAVRMSHYPPDQHFLEACDELGLYVLDEIAGWQNSYDTPTGRRIIGETVRRDVNHPCVLFWDNGNEGGWNRENDDEFAKWDPQQRHVLHPWELFRGVTTRHYRKYPEHVKLLEGPDIYMPTEFLHGLYDGGIGAGMYDYWQKMKTSRFSGGGFFWALVDEGVARSDRHGQIDNAGNLAPDGIVGPYREKKGSFFTVKELWSPIQVSLGDMLPADFSGLLVVENAYSFTNLSACQFAASLARFGEQSGKVSTTTHWTENVAGPAIEPGATGPLKLPLPSDWRDSDVLYLTAKDPSGRELWTWSWLLHSAEKTAAKLIRQRPAVEKPKLSQDGTVTKVNVGDLELRFNRESGFLVSVRKGRRELPLAEGPRLAAYRRNGRSFADLSGSATLSKFDAREDGDHVVIEAHYTQGLKLARWEIGATGVVTLSYEYHYDGTVDLLGIHFTLPEVSVTTIRWLGKGPYRVWQNRLHGTKYDIWSNEYTTSVPGELYHYPEFTGYFRDWRWARIGTPDGPFSLFALNAGSYLGLLKPSDGRAGLYSLPDVGLAVLDVIPAMRNKFHLAEETGPSGQPAEVSGTHRGAVQFLFEGESSAQ